ncbi:Poly-beta-1,6-N-acetyl-D-glucosamine N-deacetylase precursor [Maioricimonas rarisocia]|uniref:Poly-beta-1,6-N-acetyl-D-glucosamine N-deacetylase n=1 Tax=Maioricimonas rarisocia TaxID=2528026 RepID=A0A517ZCG2_9PLAN|nr:polysaccharide deacetylase family protein [Maioricimonas rarisocia]QDU40130.1 Poly-beta-1,6-N-acetyl-D-glucosamine N-deacetylase precursor [Maioricimonas rarisocia]
MVAIVKNALVSLSRSPLVDRGLTWLEQRGDAEQNLLRVLMYHRVDDADARPHLYPGMISTSPAGFREQMQFLANSYQVVSLQQVMDAARSSQPLPPRSVLLTFDDAYVDFAQHAWPVMRELGLPVTLFVPTAYPDEPTRHFWWDRLYRSLCRTTLDHPVTLATGMTIPTDGGERYQLFRQLKEQIKTMPHADAMQLVDSIGESLGAADPETNSVLGWDELRTLQREGVTLAPHTRTHPMLNRIEPSEACREIEDSWNDLNRKLDEPVPPVVAYPAGGISEQVAAAAEEAGMVLGLTTRRGMNDLERADRFQLRRINVGGRTTLGVLRSQLLAQTRFLNTR